MEEFISKYRGFLLSSLFMLAGMLTAGYSVHYTRMQAYMADLALLRGELSQERTEIRQQLDKYKEKEEDSDKGISYEPTFLQNINEIARNNEVIINQLIPDSGQHLKFTLEILTDYYTFISFISQLESLDTILDNIQVHPYDASADPPVHAISFSIIPRNDAKPLSGKRLESLQQEVERKDKRNPFQRFAYDASRKKVSPAIDLSWVYKLGGLGLSQDGKPYAIINQRNYQEGDLLDGRTITKITSNTVFLDKKDKNGTAKYTLKFRRQDKKEQGR